MLNQTVRASAEFASKHERPVIGATLDELVRVHAQKGTPLSVAVVSSVFDDLFARAELDGRPTEGRSPSLADVRVAGDGTASLGLRLRDPVRDLGTLLGEALEAGIGDTEIPPAALPVLRVATSDDPWVRPGSVSTLRALVRAALGSPGNRKEVQTALTKVSRGSIAGERMPPPKKLPKTLDSEIKLPLSLVNSELPSIDVALSSLPPHSADGTVKPAATSDASVPGNVLGLAQRAQRAEVAFRDPRVAPPLAKPRLEDGVPVSNEEPSFAPILRKQRRIQALLALITAAAAIGASIAYLTQI